MSAEGRFCRQEILPEIGAAGQARLATAPVAIPRDCPELAREFATLYARRAGLGGAILPSDAVARSDGTLEAASPILQVFVHPTPRALAQGAELALEALRNALGLPPPHSTESAVR